MTDSIESGEINGLTYHISLVDNKYYLFIEKDVINSDGTEVEYVPTGSFDSLEEAKEYVDMF